MENIEQKLMQSITTMSELELQELEIRFAKFNLELKESYESKIKSIESNIDSQIVFLESL